MANKELRKMNRTELIEIIYALQQEEQTLRQENEQLKAELEDKNIRIENSGSIAEASLSLNKIFEDAQAAAEQYLTSIKEQAARTQQGDGGKQTEMEKASCGSDPNPAVGEGYPHLQGVQL